MQRLNYTTTVEVPDIIRMPLRFRVQGEYSPTTALVVTHVALEGDREDLLPHLHPGIVSIVRLKASESLLKDLGELNAG